MQGSGRNQGWHLVAEELREKLGRFSGRPRFNDEFEEAFEFYFGESVDDLQDSLDENDYDRFMEWFLFDYRLSNGHRLIEIFDLEHGAELSRQARRLLRAWEKAHLTVLELQGRDGEIDRYLDLLTGKQYEVAGCPKDPPLPRWSIVIARPLQVGRHWEFSHSVTVLPPISKERLLQLVRGEYRRFCYASGCLSVEQFLRDHGYFFNDLLVELDLGVPAHMLEGDDAHRVVHCKAIFRARDVNRVSQRLLAYGDIRTARHGRLVMLEAEDSPGRVLAELHFAPGRLVVHCWSRERLEISKRRLVDRLKGLVLHLVDAFEELHARGPGGGQAFGPAGQDEVAAVVDGGRDAAGPGEGGAGGFDFAAGTSARAAYDDYVDSWLSEPLAALDGLPPKALLGRPLGRVRLVELLKKLEHLQETRLRKGRGLATAEEIRRQLGLPADSGVFYPLGTRPELWNSPSESQVAQRVREMLDCAGYGTSYGDSAAWMWWDYCSRAYPVMRKPLAWAAAVHYCVALVENWPVTQQRVAEYYSVSVSTLASNARRIINLLELEPFDDRYCVEPLRAPSGRRGRDEGEDEAEEADQLGTILALASRVRAAVHQFARDHESLHDRAQEYFASHVRRSGFEPEWRECFLDWFHFDWHIPVMGGRTLAEGAFDFADIGEELREVLYLWLNRRPSFYVVEGLVEGGSALPGRLGRRLTLRDLVSGKVSVVDWMRLGGEVRPKDLVFARLVGVRDRVISLGCVLSFPAPRKEHLQRAIEEDRALVNRWNERYLTWEEFRSRYSERLYAIAFGLREPEPEDED